MNHSYPYILFNKSPEQLRLLGARGGRTYGRNQRVRRHRLPSTSSPALLPGVASAATTAESIVLLDQRFPWLRGAEKRGF
jgi:hypothetical protein